MSFDIQYLLFLQTLRELTGGIFDETFNAISKLAVDIIPFLPFIVYWSTNKKWGLRYLLTFYGADLFNGVLKLTVCAYRPWIRSDLIEPAGDSKVAATGYSFPSGHTVSATCNYGNTFVWQKNRNKKLATLCVVLIALTAFSRNFLGVHTPQDVIVGFLEGVLLIYLTGKFINKYEGDDKKLDLFSILGIIIIILSIIYILFKPYPMDYVDGKLLVDPHVMMNDTFKGAGGFLGLIVGLYFDRHYIHYEIPKHHESLPMLTFVGFVIIFSWKELFAPAIMLAAFGGHWGNFIARFILVLFATTVWPMIITKVCKQKENK